ncbi:MAG: hypothetical protein H7270_11650 [Dermatophilaceae bacterium]|nr:hypothetical protein [Dermatophilaceae bacterium]
MGTCPRYSPDGPDRRVPRRTLLARRIGLYLAGSVALVVFVSSLAVLDAERGGNGPIQPFGDSLWRAMTTITTVGYGDELPVTTTSRCIALP